MNGTADINRSFASSTDFQDTKPETTVRSLKRQSPKRIPGKKGNNSKP
jgi:hypothetical protein